MEETSEELPNVSLGIDLLASIESSQQARARPTKTKHAVELWMQGFFCLQRPKVSSSRATRRVNGQEKSPYSTESKTRERLQQRNCCRVFDFLGRARNFVEKLKKLELN